METIEMSSTGDNTENVGTFQSPAEQTHQSSTPPPASTGQDDKGKRSIELEVKAKPNARQKSWVWDHFQVIGGLPKSDQKASCIYCAQIIHCPPKLGTSSLSNHLHRCKKYPYNNLEKKQKTLEFKANEGKTSKVMTAHIFDQNNCRKALAKMIIVDELPFRHVQKEGFKEFCYEMQPRFLIPSRTTVAKDCYNMFLEEKKKLKMYFEKLPSRVCLTTDTWTSIQNLNYMCLTAHFIDDDWTLHKKIINFCPISSHAGEVIAMSIEKCLLEWGISKVLTVTVDNASANDNGLQYLKKRLNSWKGTVLNGDYMHMRCAAHILSLIVREGLKDLNDHIVRIRAAIKYVRSSPARAQKFKSCVEKERIESKSFLCLDVETRWNSTYLMLESAVKFQRAFDLLETIDSKYVDELTPKVRAAKEGHLEDNEIVDDRSSRVKGLPTELDWDYANKLLPFLKVFYDTTLKLSGSLYVTGNEYMKEIYGIGFLLSKMCQSDDSGTAYMASKMKKKHDKYWGKIDRINIFVFIATILDPRYKLSYVFWVIDKTYDVNTAVTLKEKIKLVLYSMFEAYGAPLLRSKQATNQVEGKSIMDVDQIVGAADYMNALYNEHDDDLDSAENKTELDIYLLEMKADRNDKSFKILNWWKANAPRYPILAMMARDLMAMPVSTVASESAFSAGGRVLDPFRSSLTPKMVEALICAQDWLRKNHEPIYLEECLEELEKLELEIPGSEEHHIINIEM